MVKKIDCFIPCRKNGDFLKNLNFLEIDHIKLVEHTINCSIKSKLFRNIYILTNDKTSFFSLMSSFSSVLVRSSTCRASPRLPSWTTIRARPSTRKRAPTWPQTRRERTFPGAPRKSMTSTVSATLHISTCLTVAFSFFGFVTLSRRVSWQPWQ